MRYTVIAVGRQRAGPEMTLFEAYAARLGGRLALIEVEERRKLDPARRVAREGALLLGKLPPGIPAVALDAAGQALSSERLAAELNAWRAGGAAGAAFLIGGADGLDAAVLARADLVLSLGPMTWPHLLVRAMLAEQLYRAEMIAQGHPYHRPGPPPGRR